MREGKREEREEERGREGECSGERDVEGGGREGFQIPLSSAGSELRAEQPPFEKKRELQPLFFLKFFISEVNK